MRKVSMHLTKGTLVFVAFGMLMACGTKGPLYIPEQRYPQQTDPNTSDKAKKPAVPPVNTLPTVKDY